MKRYLERERLPDWDEVTFLEQCKEIIEQNCAHWLLMAKFHTQDDIVTDEQGYNDCFDQAQRAYNLSRMCKAKIGALKENNDETSTSSL